MADPLVHVLIINWNGREHLDECFSTLLKSDYPNARFVLLDNASSDDSVAFVTEKFAGDARVEILKLDENLGWSGGNNAGMRAAIDAGADYILLLNNDTATDPDAISCLVAQAESNSDIGALAPKLLMYDNPDLINSVGLEASIIGAAWDQGIGRLDGAKWEGHRPVIGVCGAGFFIRASVLERTGLLPEDFEIYLDDLDLSLRIWSAGHEILTCPEARIRHKFSSTMGEGKRARHKYYLNTRNRMRLILRNFPAAKLPLVILLYKIGEIRAVGRAFLDGEPWRILAHARAWVDALLYLPVALKARKERPELATGAPRFWGFVRRDLSFYPGTEFPDHGWYPEIDIDGQTLRPISVTATHDHAGGELSIRHANPYPHVTSLSIRVMQGDQLLTTVHGTESHVTSIDAPPGTITLIADTLFDAEHTGLPYDVGGWIAISS